MKQKYTFFDGGTIKFDDKKSVKELIAAAFDSFDYYEPLGMDIVTLFQAHHSKTNTGWFTTDVEVSCAEEIENPNELCFAYHLPNVFYFAEGGWGHHMAELGNHPEIPNAVSLSLRFDDFDNTLVINGQYSFNDIIHTLKRADYIPDSCKFIKVIPIGCGHKSYSIPFSDSLMSICLTDFREKINQYNSKHIKLESGEFIYYEIFEIC